MSSWLNTESNFLLEFDTKIDMGSRWKDHRSSSEFPLFLYPIRPYFYVFQMSTTTADYIWQLFRDNFQTKANIRNSGYKKLLNFGTFLQLGFFLLVSSKLWKKVWSCVTCEDTDARMRLRQALSKNLFLQEILNKIFGP